MFTTKDYLDVIQPLLAELNQLKPDGKSCAICGDSGHQAWECHHNPLVIIQRVKTSESKPGCDAPFGCDGCPDWYKRVRAC